jgi:glycerol kinase
LDQVRATTGLVLDPYFSATKIAWLLRNGVIEDSPGLCLGTVDSWIIWNLTGGPDGGSFVTDPTNASRTLLFDINKLEWSTDLAELFGVPHSALAEVRPSSGRLGTIGSRLGPIGSPLHATSVSGVAGDQQAALFGQVCTSPGMAKATYGTGSFVLLNVGDECPPPAAGLLTTVAWDLGDAGKLPGAGGSSVAYALEGAVFSTGAAIQWLRDGLEIIGQASDVGPLALKVDSTEGVYVVPAFTGLGSPFWDPHARGTILGLGRGTGAAHIARAVIESIAFQVRDVVDAMVVAAGRPLTELRVDGGAAVLDLLLQLQSDQLQVAVARPSNTDRTAIGAAMLAGLAEGVWGSVDDLSAAWELDTRFEPSFPKEFADISYAGWSRAVERSLGWAEGLDQDL